MEVNELIKKLQSLNKDLKEKTIGIQRPDGIIGEPEIKLVLKDEMDVLNHSAENIDYVIITGV
jgi:hypothetical protein